MIKRILFAGALALASGITTSSVMAEPMLQAEKTETVRVELTVSRAREILPQLPEVLRGAIELALETIDEDHIIEVTFSYSLARELSIQDGELRPNVRDGGGNNKKEDGHCKVDVTIKDKGKSGGSVDVGNRVVGGSGDAHHDTDREVTIHVEGSGSTDDCVRGAENLIRATRP